MIVTKFFEFEFWYQEKSNAFELCNDNLVFYYFMHDIVQIQDPKIHVPIIIQIFNSLPTSQFYAPTIYSYPLLQSKYYTLQDINFHPYIVAAH